MVEALFRSALRTFGVKPGSQKTQAYVDLETALRQGRRPYHNLRHVEQVLEAFLTLEEDLDPFDSARVTLALCYHDAVYEPGAKDNEARSAALMRETLSSLGIDEADLAEIERLILATRDHVAGNPLSALVVDADLSILAASPEAYDAYAKAIRKEYAHVPDEAYRAGRTEFLRGLLDRRLFTSPLMDEEAARANIEREIEGLA